MRVGVWACGRVCVCVGVWACGRVGVCVGVWACRRVCKTICIEITHLAVGPRSSKVLLHEEGIACNHRAIGAPDTVVLVHKRKRPARTRRLVFSGPVLRSAYIRDFGVWISHLSSSRTVSPRRSGRPDDLHFDTSAALPRCPDSSKS
jgi:hypothetical protein